MCYNDSWKITVARAYVKLTIGNIAADSLYIIITVGKVIVIKSYFVRTIEKVAVDGS